MLRIRILGKGLIPRGLGLAPRLTPFPADLNLIQTIMQAGGFKIEMQKPDGSFVELTRKNLNSMWKAYRDVPLAVKQEAAPVTAPQVPKEKFNSVPQAPKVEAPKPVTPIPAPLNDLATPVITEEDPKDEVKEEEKTEEVKDNNNQYNGGNRNNNNNNHHDKNRNNNNERNNNGDDKKNDNNTLKVVNNPNEKK